MADEVETPTGNEALVSPAEQEDAQKSTAIAEAPPEVPVPEESAVPVDETLPEVAPDELAQEGTTTESPSTDGQSPPKEEENDQVEERMEEGEEPRDYQPSVEVETTMDQDESKLDMGSKLEIQKDFSKSKSSIGLRSAGSRRESMLEAKRKITDRKRTGALGSIISIRRGNQEYYERQKVPKFANSYKLESDKPFNHGKVENILREVLEEALENLTYDPDRVPKQAKWASSAIRAKVKEQEYDRYKIVCVVTIGEKRSQDIYEIVRFLWDAERDKYAKHVHENMHVFAVALCFGLYYE